MFMSKKKNLSTFYIIAVIVLFAVCSLAGIIRKQETMILGAFIWCLILAGAWFFRPSSPVHRVQMDARNVRHNLIMVFLIVALILLCTVLMSLSPHWNGTYASEVSGYEEMTDAILKGQIWLDIEVDPRLAALENPYDIHARDAIPGLREAWDHAFYNGRYYMYFGIVPVFLVFLPMYFLTGTIILSYHATQIIAAFTIIGLFLFFKAISQTFFPSLRFSLYIFICIISTSIIMWYVVCCPALYCTATLSGVCLMIWSLYFFTNAVFIQKNENCQIAMAFGGSIFGALVIGCRPPIAIANICVLPLLIVYLHSKPITPKLIWKLVLAALPYVVIIGLLLFYNKARFDSFFEFGQSYQITLEDQHEYASFLSVFSWEKLLHDLQDTFFKISPLKTTFPYISYSGLFVSYPVLFFIFLLPFHPVLASAKRAHLTGFLCSLFIVPVLSILMDGLWSPFLLERYKLDFNFLLCILLFFSFGFLSANLTPAGECRLAFITYFFTVSAVLVSLLFFLIPMDYNYTYYYGEKTLDLFDSILFFWRYI